MFTKIYIHSCQLIRYTYQKTKQMQSINLKSSVFVKTFPYSFYINGWDIKKKTNISNTSYYMQSNLTALQSAASKVDLTPLYKSLHKN